MGRGSSKAGATSVKKIGNDYAVKKGGKEFLITYQGHDGPFYTKYTAYETTNGKTKLKGKYKAIDVNDIIKQL